MSVKLFLIFAASAATFFSLAASNSDEGFRYTRTDGRTLMYKASTVLMTWIDSAKVGPNLTILEKDALHFITNLEHIALRINVPYCVGIGAQLCTDCPGKEFTVEYQLIFPAPSTPFNIYHASFRQLQDYGMILSYYRFI